MTKATHNDTKINIGFDRNDGNIETVARDVIAHLTARGFTMYTDDTISPLIRDNYRSGKKGLLECDTEVMGCYFSVEFYQNVVTENRHGGKYDFDKLAKMPYLIRQQFWVEFDHIKTMLQAKHGITLEKQARLTGQAFIDDQVADLAKFQGWTTPRAIEAYNARSAIEGVLIQQEDKVFFRDKGRWMTGIAHHNINNMWWVLLPSGEVRNHGSFHLWTITPPNLRGRQFNEDYIERQIHKAKLKAYENNEGKRAQALRDQLLPAEPYYVISLKHTGKKDRTITLWGVAGSGYSDDFTHAGQYSKEDILRHVDHYNSGSNIAVDAETVERLALWMKNENDYMSASLPNTPWAWGKLLANTIAQPKYAQLPALLEPPKRSRRKAEA